MLRSLQAFPESSYSFVDITKPEARNFDINDYRHQVELVTDNPTQLYQQLEVAANNGASIQALEAMLEGKDGNFLYALIEQYWKRNNSTLSNLYSLLKEKYQPLLLKSKEDLGSRPRGIFIDNRMVAKIGFAHEESLHVGKTRTRCQITYAKVGGQTLMILSDNLNSSLVNASIENGLQYLAKGQPKVTMIGSAQINFVFENGKITAQFEDQLAGENTTDSGSYNSELNGAFSNTLDTFKKTLTKLTNGSEKDLALRSELSFNTTQSPHEKYMTAAAEKAAQMESIGRLVMDNLGNENYAIAV